MHVTRTSKSASELQTSDKEAEARSRGGSSKQSSLSSIELKRKALPMPLVLSKSRHALKIKGDIVDPLTTILSFHAVLANRDLRKTIVSKICKKYFLLKVCLSGLKFCEEKYCASF